jgi:hypothetical protein
MPYKNKLRVLRLTALAIKFTHSQFKTFSDFRVIYRVREYVAIYRMRVYMNICYMRVNTFLSTACAWLYYYLFAREYIPICYACIEYLGICSHGRVIRFYLSTRPVMIMI